MIFLCYFLFHEYTASKVVNNNDVKSFREFDVCVADSQCFFVDISAGSGVDDSVITALGVFNHEFTIEAVSVPSVVFYHVFHACFIVCDEDIVYQEAFAGFRLFS